MYQKAKKLLAALCVVALMVTALPAIPAKAATAAPKFKKTYATLYENTALKGKYTYTLTNLKKGQTVKWGVIGAGKAYVKVGKTSIKATKSTMSNTVTVKTDGKTAAKFKKVVVYAKVYSSAGKLQYTVKTGSKIMIRPTAVTIDTTAPLTDNLNVGKSYDFSYTITPANATSSNVWTVTDEKGADYSSYISSSGVFKPMKAGTYTIKLSAKIGSKVIKSASKTVKVADYLMMAKQSTASKIELTYSGDMREQLKLEDFSVKNTNGASAALKSIAFSEDGKKVTLTALATFNDGVSYTVSDKTTSIPFQASVGVPVELKILTEKVTVGKETALQHALYDQKGVDVTEIYKEALEYKPEVTNGILTDDKKLYMNRVGATATITATYVNKENSNIRLTDTAVIICVAAEISDETNFTLTNATTEPDYSSAKYKDNRKVAIGSTYYAHFRALDGEKSVITYSDVKYESSDPDTMIITADGKVTPIKNGTVKVIVTATYLGEKYIYTYDVTIAEAPYLKEIKLSTSSVSMSNVYATDYREYIDVMAYDQYNESFQLENEAYNFTQLNNTNKPNQVVCNYDAASNRISISATNADPGTYSFALGVTSGAQKTYATFSVVVSAVPLTGAESYEIQIDKTTADMSLTKDVSSSQYVNVRLAKYRGGVFLSYNTFVSATVMKDGYYYGDDLTLGGSTAKQTIGGSDRLSLKTLDINTGVCRKAETGTYTITLQYYVSGSTLTRTTTLTLTDTQDQPEVRIDRVKATKSCSTALELAQNCLTPVNGTITECVVTGESQPGSKVAVKAGDQINIRSVTVEGKYKIAGAQEVTVTYTIDIQKTLTNI